MGILCRKRKDYAAAMAYYEKAVAARPTYAEAYSSMVVIALRQGRDAKALEYARKAYDLDRTNPAIVANLGTAFFRRLARLAVERGCGRMEWWVLDWNEPALRFYRGIGAVPMSDWTVQRVSGEALERLGQCPSEPEA